MIPSVISRVVYFMGLCENQFPFGFDSLFKIGNSQFFLHRISFESVLSKRISHLKTRWLTKVEGRDDKRISRKLRALQNHLIFYFVDSCV